MKAQPTIERIEGAPTRFRWLAMIPTTGKPRSNPDDVNSVLVPVSVLAASCRTRLGARLWIARNRHRGAAA